MKTSKMFLVLVLVAFCISMLSGIALAEEKINVKGKITAFDVDKKTVNIKADDGKEMSFVIESEKALKKLDDRLFVGDEVKIRYVIRDGKNLILDGNDLRGTKPGC